MPDFVELRPSQDRIRETLFNWLMPYIHNARCLDIFSGSGVLGFECISRGAQLATLVDKHPQVVQHLQQQKQIFQTTQIEIIQADVLQWLAQPAPHAYDIVFIDPPFASDLWLQTCKLLTEFNWLAPGAHIYIEHPAQHELQLPASWQELKQQKAGNVCYGLYTI